jgi:hypothetical protein
MRARDNRWGGIGSSARGIVQTNGAADVERVMDTSEVIRVVADPCRRMQMTIRGGAKQIIKWT